MTYTIVIRAGNESGYVATVPALLRLRLSLNGGIPISRRPQEWIPAY